MIKFHQNRMVSFSLFLLIVVFSYFVFSPGFSGGFIFDDSSNLYRAEIYALLSIVIAH